MGFYGNGETSDGIHRATYSLRHANRTVAGVQDRVSAARGRGASCPPTCLCARSWGGRGSALTAGPAQVWDTAAALNRTADPNLQSLERQLATRPEPLRAVQRLQDLLEALLGYTSAIPFWRNPDVSLEALAEQVDLYDWYRCGPVLFPANGPPLQAPMPIPVFQSRLRMPLRAPRGPDACPPQHPLLPLPCPLCWAHTCNVPAGGWAT